jgi:hypothetical protein
MSTQEGDITERPVIICGQIRDPKRKGPNRKDVYTRGEAKGLLRFEIAIPVMQLRKVVSAFPRSYKAFPVSIVLLIGQSEYSGRLSLPESRKQDLYSNEVVREQWLEPWISAKLKDKNGRDVKLAYALKLGGFESESTVKLNVSGIRVSVLSS